MASVTNRDEFLRALDAALAVLPPGDQVRASRLLADTVTGAHLRDNTDAYVYQLTRSSTYAEVASVLGVTADTVKKAVKRHNAASREA